MYSKIVFLIGVASVCCMFQSCSNEQPAKKPKILEEKDPLVKIIEEKDSMVVYSNDQEKHKNDTLKKNK